MRAKQRFGGSIQFSLPALILLLLSLWGECAVRADIPLPPKPATYFTDQAGVVDAATASSINAELEQFERDTSNQILVAIYPSLPPDAEIAQYATMTYNAWGVGQKGPSLGQKGGNNGAILFVFVNDHRMFIATGRGLEGALPDATCKDIITGVIAPAFKQGDYAGGVRDGVNAMLAATRGEYKGSGRTHAEQQGTNSDQGIPAGVIIIAIIIFTLLSRFGNRPFVYSSGGYGGGGYWGGGFGGGGGGFSGGGGGFSGGGGSSAGGGAGGSW